MSQDGESSRPGRESTRTTGQETPTESKLTRLGHPKGKLAWGGVFWLLFVAEDKK
jgi:hypothetical protein